MATEYDVNKSRRFDLGMSRRTRRSTSTIACYQDQHVPPLTQQLHQDAKLKALFQGQDTEEQPPYPYEDQEFGSLQTPLQCKGDEQKIQNRYHDEQEDKLHHYLDEEQKKLHHHLDEDQEKKLHHYLDEEQEKKPHQHQDGERKTPKQCLDEDQKTLLQCQDEEKVPSQYEDEKVPNQYEDEDTPGQYQDEEQKSAKQCEEEEEEEEQKTSEKNQDEEHKTLKAQQQCQDEEHKTLGQCIAVKKLITPPCADDVPRFSLQDLIQEKQLLIGEAKATGKLGSETGRKPLLIIKSLHLRLPAA